MMLACEQAPPIDVNAEPTGLFALRLLAYVEKVVAQSKPLAATYSFGPLDVEMQVVGDNLRRCLTQAIDFATLLNANERASYWKIMAIDGAVAGVDEPQAWNFPVTNRRHLERLHYYGDHQIGLRYNPTARTWMAIFGARRLAVVWTADAERLPDWYASAPCRDLFHWMTLPTECFLAHAAAIGIGDTGVLLTGPGGSGKSTTVATAVLGGLATAGDDFILIDPRTGLAHALYDCIKLDRQCGGRLSELARHSANPDAEPATKLRIHLSHCRPSSFFRHLPIRAVLLPRVDGASETTIVPATQGEAMRALVPSTVCLIRGGEIETIRKASSFIRTMRAYHCSLGPNPEQTVAAIISLIAGLSE
jgi:hypothetical protein